LGYEYEFCIFGVCALGFGLCVFLVVGLGYRV
jgi:hypothetical protein